MVRICHIFNPPQIKQCQPNYAELWRNIVVLCSIKADQVLLVFYCSALQSNVCTGDHHNNNVGGRLVVWLVGGWLVGLLVCWLVGHP